jgi:hypothetical protein
MRKPKQDMRKRRPLTSGQSPSDAQAENFSLVLEPHLRTTWFIMDLEDQLRRYFGTTDLSAMTPEGFAAGIERIKVDLGLETDRGRRFALWALLFACGEAPDLDVVFPDEEDRTAARNFMDLAAEVEKP